MTHAPPRLRPACPSYLFCQLMSRTLGMYSLIVPAHNLPVRLPPFASAEWGLQSRGTTGRESHESPPSMAPGEPPFPVGPGLATQFLWPRPPQTCSAGSHLSGIPGRAAQSCAPPPWRSTPERWRLCRCQHIKKTIPPGSS